MYEFLAHQWGFKPCDLEEMTNSLYFRYLDSLTKRLDPKQSKRTKRDDAAFMVAMKVSQSKGGQIMFGKYPLLKSERLAKEHAN